MAKKQAPADGKDLFKARKGKAAATSGMTDTTAVAPRKGKGQVDVQTCVACRAVAFVPMERDVSEFPLLDNLNASEHCEKCWRELAARLGRKWGAFNEPLDPPARLAA